LRRTRARARSPRLSRKVAWRLDRCDPGLVTAILYAGLRGWPLPERYRATVEEWNLSPRLRRGR